MMKACRKEEFDGELEAVCTFYKDDFNQELLRAQLKTFGVHFEQLQACPTEEKSTKLSIFDIKSYFLSLSPGQMSLLSQVKRLLQLVLVMPATNATSERSSVH